MIRNNQTNITILIMLLLGIALNTSIKSSEADTITLQDHDVSKKTSNKQKIYAIQYSQAKADSIDTEIKSFHKKINALLTSKNFQELESIAEDYRSNTRFFQNGSIKLEQFYTGISINRKNTSIKLLKKEIDFLKEWTKAIPESVAAQVALAAAHKDLAWEYRGSGVSSTITEEGRQGFTGELKAAWDILTQAEKLSQKDPHLYATKLIVGLGIKQK